MYVHWIAQRHGVVDCGDDQKREVVAKFGSRPDSNKQGIANNSNAVVEGGALVRLSTYYIKLDFAF